MANGFVQRFKGKIATVWGGIWQSGIQSSAVLHNAGAPSNGTTGTGAGIAGPGALLVDTTNKVLYQNSNTLLSPTWTALTTATGAGTYTGTFDGVTGGNTPAAGSFTALSSSGLASNSAAAGLTASVTQTQAGGYAMTKQVNEFSTVANANDAATLAVLTPGQWQEVYNDGAHAMKIFPGSGQAIDAAGANAAVTLTNAKAAIFTCTATNVIKSTLLGATSS